MLFSQGSCEDVLDAKESLAACRTRRILCKIPSFFHTAIPLLFCALLVGAILPARASWKAGIAKVNITPQHSLWMAGYAARTHASQGTLLELHAKALALEDETGHRAVLVTTDLLGLPGSVGEVVATRVKQK